MLERREFIRRRKVRGRFYRYDYSRRRLPNVEEYCTGWYLFGVLPLFVSVWKTIYLTDAK